MRGIVLYTLLSLDGAVDHPASTSPGRAPMASPTSKSRANVAVEGPSRQLKP
jgi:hypothetical protein